MRASGVRNTLICRLLTLSRHNDNEFGMCAGSGQEDPVAHLELFCNPNAYSTAFDARVLVTLKAAGGVAVTTEGRLSALKADVENFLDGPKGSA